MTTHSFFHTETLLATGFRALGTIIDPEIRTQYFVQPTECRLAFISTIRGHEKLRTYIADPLEILAIATQCLMRDRADRADAVRSALALLTAWGVPFAFGTDHKEVLRGDPLS